MKLEELTFEDSKHGPYHTAADGFKGLWVIVDRKRKYQVFCPKCGADAIERVNWYASKERDDDLWDECENGHKFLEAESEVIEVERIPGENEGLAARVLNK